MTARQHWETIYTDQSADSVSWYQARAEPSLRMIEASGIPRDAAILDVGGGASVLMDNLLDAGHTALASLDLSATAQNVARHRLGARADDVRWIRGNILSADLPATAVDLWHDRAVFHFLTDAADRRSYREQLLHALKPDGHLVIATFAEDGPTRCSGLPVQRYSATDLEAAFAPHFTLRHIHHEEHATPFGTTQRFVFGWFQRCGGVVGVG